MTDAEPPRMPGPRPRYEPIAMGGVFKRSAVVVYGLLAVGLAGLAVYMATVGARDLTSMYVAAPAIGALWFGLRVFMMLAPRR